MLLPWARAHENPQARLTAIIPWQGLISVLLILAGLIISTMKDSTLLYYGITEKGPILATLYILAVFLMTCSILLTERFDIQGDLAKQIVQEKVIFAGMVKTQKIIDFAKIREGSGLNPVKLKAILRGLLAMEAITGRFLGRNNFQVLQYNDQFIVELGSQFAFWNHRGGKKTRNA